MQTLTRTCDDLHTNKHYGLNMLQGCRHEFQSGEQTSAGEKSSNWEKMSSEEQKCFGTKVQQTKVLYNWLENKHPGFGKFG